MIMIPAANLSSFEKNNKTFPNAEAATPREIKTNEKPKQNSIVLISTFLLSLSISFNFSLISPKLSHLFRISFTVRGKSEENQIKQYKYKKNLLITDNHVKNMIDQFPLVKYPLVLNIHIIPCKPCLQL